jgi:hypothetical protein
VVTSQARYCSIGTAYSVSASSQFRGREAFIADPIRLPIVNADTFFTSPSGTDPIPGRPGKISFSFFWSIPNRIPLHPDEILHIWKLVKDLNFHTCMGAFKGQDVRTMENEEERGTGGAKGRLLESCKIYIRAMGWKEDQHGIFAEKL